MSNSFSSSSSDPSLERISDDGSSSGNNDNNFYKSLKSLKTGKFFFIYNKVKYFFKLYL